MSNDDRVHISYKLTPNDGADLVLLQGPTLCVGERAFGARKDDALVGGLEWLVGDEVSSSNLDMHDPDFYLRFVPHPNKITIPLMAVAQGGAALAVYWDCLQRWDGRHDRPAAVFASPNFLDGQTNHLLGLFLPSVPDWVPPNQREASSVPYPAAAWRYDAGISAVTAKLVTGGSNWVEVSGATYQAVGQVFPVARAVDFNFDRSLQGWTPAHDIDRLEVNHGTLRGTATGGDFEIDSIRGDRNR